MAVGQVVGWQPEGSADDEPALWRIAMADGDVEDLEEGELNDALQAAQEERDAAQEVESILEAAWEALEMAVALHAHTPGHELQRSEAHERLGDAAMQNDQPERAKHEYADARLLLVGLRDAGRLDKSDRRLADIEFYSGMAALRMGDLPAARQHYKQASALLRLRKANLALLEQQQRRAQLEREVAGEAGEAGVAGDTGLGDAPGAAGEAGEAGAAEWAAEMAQIDELVVEIGGRLREME